MNPIALAVNRHHFERVGALQTLRPHAGPLILACGLAGALLAWSMPAAPETRCMLAQQAALGWQAALSLSIALTALVGYAHKPVLRRWRTIGLRLRRD